MKEIGKMIYIMDMAFSIWKMNIQKWKDILRENYNTVEIFALNDIASNIQIQIVKTIKLMVYAFSLQQLDRNEQIPIINKA
jgi:hypothetical protein